MFDIYINFMLIYIYIISDTMKIECNKNNEKVFHSSILKNLEPLENNCSNISHSTIELVCSPFSEISTVSENKNDYLEVSITIVFVLLNITEVP